MRENAYPYPTLKMLRFWRIFRNHEHYVSLVSAPHAYFALYHGYLLDLFTARLELNSLES